MPMSRILWVACCALLPLVAAAQRGRVPGGGGDCPTKSAECQLHLPVFDFGRQAMNQQSPPANAHNTIAVTCRRSREAEQQNREVHVTYWLRAKPPAPDRVMRNALGQDPLSYLRYTLYVDAGRTNHWGDGEGNGAYFTHVLYLDRHNPIGTYTHTVFGRVDGQQTVRPGQQLGAVVAELEFESTYCR